MSRLKRRQKRKITQKKRIKATIGGLALTLAIGVSPSVSTYAWFTDSETIVNDLVINMGEINVDVTTGFKKTDVKPGDSFKYEFDIVNNGSLKQHLRLNLECENKEILKYIDYKIEFEAYNGKNISSIEGTLDGLENNLNELRYADGSLVVLEAGHYIDATYTVTISKDIKKELVNSFVDKHLKIDLNVLANQVNNDNVIQEIGFSDKAIQSNYIKFKEIDEPDIPQDGNVKVELVANENTVKITINGIEGIENKNIYNIEVTGGTGTFANNIEVTHDNSNIVFIQKNPIGDFNITNTVFDDSNTLTLKFIMNDGKYKEIKFRFRIKYKNETKYDLEAYYEVVSFGTVEIPINPEVIEEPKEEIPTKPEVVEPPKEEEVPSEPEAVEPPKEEIEIPSEPEVVEPPKEEAEVPTEPEMVEPPKEEEVVIPKQPEIIDPPKEDEIEVEE